MPLSLHWMNNILWLPIPVIQQIMIRFKMVGTHLTRRTLIILLPLKILNLLVIYLHKSYFLLNFITMFNYLGNTPFEKNFYCWTLCFHALLYFLHHLH
uniref:Uncharacterized protein n=1 Tax=Hordeum vulgare subsp. vulgare TaxID=112509 RepID=A0A8I6YPA8_HORVV